MINKINSNAQRRSFTGTTIVEQEGGAILTKEIMKAANNSTGGLINTRLDGYSIVIVADVFKKEENNFLSQLDKKGLTYINSSKVLNYKLYDFNQLKNIVKTIAKTGLL